VGPCVYVPFGVQGIHLIVACLPDGLQESTDPHMCVGYPVPVKAALPRSKDEIIDEKHARYKHTPPVLSIAVRLRMLRSSGLVQATQSPCLLTGSVGDTAIQRQAGQARGGSVQSRRGLSGTGQFSGPDSPCVSPLCLLHGRALLGPTTRAVPKPGYISYQQRNDHGLQDHSYICQGGVKQGSNDTTVRTLYDNFIYSKLCEDICLSTHFSLDTHSDDIGCELVEGRQVISGVALLAVLSFLAACASFFRLGR
jgi:hypothetical protein